MDYTILRILLIAGLAMTAAAEDPQYAAFWRWFERHQQTYRDFSQVDASVEKAFDALAAEMNKLHPKLTFEFGPRSATREFIVSADGFRSASAAVRMLVAAAPRLPGWTVIPFRQPKTTTVGVEYGGERVDLKTARFKLFPSGADRIGILLLVDPKTYQHKERHDGSVWLTLDSIVGEEAMIEGAGQVIIEDQTHGLYKAFLPDTVPLGQFRDVFLRERVQRHRP